MKKFIPLIISLACTANTYALDNENAYVTKVANTINYVNQNQDKIWPGFTINNPIMIDFRGTHHGYAFNFSPINPNWKKTIIDNLPVYVLDKDEYGIEENCGDQCWNSGQKIIDEQDMRYEVFPQELIDQDEPALAVVNTSFYDYSQKTSMMMWKLHRKYDGYNQLTNVKLAYLERAVLAAYLSGEQSENILKDAIAIHQYRSLLLNTESALSENGMQGFLGTATYVMFKSLNVQDKTLIDKLNYYHCSAEDISKTESPIQNLHSCMWMGHASFFGAGYGYALDHSALSNSWKTQVTDQAKSPTSILQEYFHLTEKEARNRTMNAMQDSHYAYDKIEHDVDAVLKHYLKEMETQQEKYNKLDGTELQFSKIYLGYIDSSEAEYSVNTRESLYVNATGNTELCTPVSGGTCEMTLNHIPFIYTDKVKLSSNTKIIINNLETTLENFIKNVKYMAFTDLLIKNAQFTLDIKNSKGQLNVVDGKMQLSFEDESSSNQPTNSKDRNDLIKHLSKHKMMDRLLS